LGVDRYEDEPGPFDIGAFHGSILMTDPMSDDVAVCGAARLKATLRTDQPGGLIVARLVDVDREGRAVRMTTGALDLRFRSGLAAPSGPEPGAEMAIIVDFQATAWRLRRGHRLGLALSADGWPALWPDPLGASLNVQLNGLQLHLPLADAARRPAVFDPPTRTARADVGALQWIDPPSEVLPPSALGNTAAYDSCSAAHHLPSTGTDYFSVSRFEVALADEGHQGVAIKTARTVFQRPDWSVRIDTSLTVASTPVSFDIRWSVRAEHDGVLVHECSHAAVVPRGADGVGRAGR
jgi:hypothetical protein